GDATAAEVFALHGRRVLIAGTDLRVIEVGRGELARMPREPGKVRAAASLFGGRALAVLVASEPNPSFVVLRPTGGLVHKVAVPRAEQWAIAENRGLALLVTDDRTIVTIDLRYGRVLNELEMPVPATAIAVDADGQFVAFAGEPESAGGLPSLVHVPYTELLS